MSVPSSRQIKVFRNFCLCVMLLSLSTAAYGSESPTDVMVDQVYNRLVNLKPDKSKAAFVEHFQLERPAAKLNFKDGNFYFCHPINNQISAALFIGQGSVSYTPISELEQHQLQAEFDSTSFYDTFNIAFLIFADSLMEEFQKEGIHLQANFTPTYVYQYIDDFLEYIVNEEGRYLEVDIIKTILEAENNGLFCAQINTHHHGRLAYEINPFEEESVRLLKIEGKGKPSELISTFNISENPSTSSRYNIQKNRLERVHLDIKIAWDYEINANATFKMKVSQPQKWIYVKLDKSFDVKKVERKGYGEVKFIKHKNRPYVWIKVGEVAEPKSSLVYSIEYTGNPLRQVAGRLALSPETMWYPQLDAEDPVFYDLTFNSPSHLRLSSVGNKVLDTLINGKKITRWLPTQSLKKISFSIGDFRELCIQDKRLPDIHVWQYHATHSGEKIMHVGKDVAESYLLFQTLYGKRSYKKIWVTEIPFLYGQAYDGYINLTTKVFDDYKHNWNEIFTAHEIAHLWWGLGVKYKTYHDRWLAESFAEYSALLYLETIDKNQNVSNEILNGWKAQLLEEKMLLASENKQLKSLWLGTRLAKQDDGKDFELIIYKKGAWVLHMLRHMMMNLENLSDQDFYAMLRAFYESYDGQYITTRDFKNFVEQYTHQDMGWFFNQWVKGEDIPHYKYSYSYQKRAENTYNLKITVYQEVAENKPFKMMVPFQIDFGHNQFLRFRSMVENEKTVIEIKDLPLKPKRITFNYLNAVLCSQEEINPMQGGIELGYFD